MSMVQPLVVGAGPAGVRAARALVRAGLRPPVVDEAPACEIYRQRLVLDERDGRALYGWVAGKAERLHQAPVKPLPLCLAPDAGLEAEE
jgi:2-polyprenyl-6-methoxyphenol hydroxylase-like FAD-dependent oxidoreductase